MTEAKIVITAQDKTGASFDSVKRGLSGVGERAGAVTAMLSGIGVTGALVGMVALVRQSAEAIDKFNDLKDATGAGIENISALDRIARETGSTYEVAASALVKFNKVLTEGGDEGSKAAAVLKALGLNVNELKAMDPAEAMRQTAVALSRWADDGNKARAVQILFGKSVQEVAPFLADLAKKTELTGQVSTQAADDMEKFNQAMARSKANAEDLWRTLAMKVIPVINQLFDDFKTFGQKASLAGIASEVLAADRAVKALEARKGSLLSSDESNAKAMDAAIARLAKAKAAFNGADTNRPRTSYDTLEDRSSLNIPDDPKGGKTSKASADRPFTGLSYDEQITRKAGQLLEDSDITRAREYADTLSKLDQLFFSGAIHGDLYDSAIKKLSKSTSEAGKEVDLAAEAEKRLADLMRASTGGQIEAQRRDMLLLAQAFEKGTISVDQFNDAASVRLGLKGNGPDEDPIAKRLSKGIEDGILSGFRSGKSITDVFLDELKKQFGKTILSPIIKPIAEFGSGLISGGLQALGASLFGLPGHANGLSYVPYDNYVARLHKGERVLTAAENKAGGAGQTIHITMAPVIGNIASKDDVIKGMQAAVNQTLAKLQRAGAYGGSAA